MASQTETSFVFNKERRPQHMKIAEIQMEHIREKDDLQPAPAFLPFPSFSPPTTVDLYALHLLSNGQPIYQKQFEIDRLEDAIHRKRIAETNRRRVQQQNMASLLAPNGAYPNRNLAIVFKTGNRSVKMKVKNEFKWTKLCVKALQETNLSVEKKSEIA